MQIEDNNVKKLLQTSLKPKKKSGKKKAGKKKEEDSTDTEMKET